MADQRSRNWTFIVYPESVKKDWIDYLRDYPVVAAISPIHNQDLKEGDSKDFENLTETEFKKAHYHVVITFKSVKSFSQIQEITNYLGASMPKAVADLPAMTQYLTHKNNLDKAQYNYNDINCLNGYPLEKLYISEDEIQSIQEEVLNYIFSCDNHLTFTDLTIISMNTNPLWKVVLFSYQHSFIIREILKDKEKTKWTA